MRIVFLGSPAVVIPPLAALQGLGAKHELVAVVSQPARPAGRGSKLTDPPVAVFAKERGIPVFQPDRASDPTFLKQLGDLRPDVCITAAYGQILTEAFLAIPSRATINIHPSLLPEYRGASPVQSALFDGRKSTGVSILFTVRKLDAGNLIVQKQVCIDPLETADALMERLFQLGGALLQDSLLLLADPSFAGTPQDEAVVTHCRKFHKDDGRIDWRLTSHEIESRYRAFKPWPSIFTFHGERRLTVAELDLGVRHGLQGKTLVPGEFIYDKAGKSLLVGTGDGNVAVTRLKPAGGREVEAAAFWNGLKSDVHCFEMPAGEARS